MNNQFMCEDAFKLAKALGLKAEVDGWCLYLSNACGDGSQFDLLKPAGVPLIFNWRILSSDTLDGEGDGLLRSRGWGTFHRVDYITLGCGAVVFGGIDGDNA